MDSYNIIYITVIILHIQCVPSVSVALATILVSFSFKLIVLECGLLLVILLLQYLPVPSDMRHCIGTLGPHKCLASCSAIAEGLLVNIPPSYIPYSVIVPVYSTVPVVYMVLY